MCGCRGGGSGIRGKGTRGHGDTGTRGRGQDELAVSPRLPVSVSGDSLAAHQTMYEVLVTLSHLLAPFTPFIADEMYRNLVCCGNATEWF